MLNNQTVSYNKKQLANECQFIWLDPNINKSEEIQSSIERLEQIMPCAMSTDNYDECKQLLNDYHENKQTFLIVSNKFGKKLVPHIHSLAFIIGIYIYCTDRKIHTMWAKSYFKVHSVSSNTGTILKKLIMDAKQLTVSKSARLSNIREGIYDFILSKP